MAAPNFLSASTGNEGPLSSRKPPLTPRRCPDATVTPRRGPDANACRAAGLASPRGLAPASAGRAAGRRTDRPPSRSSGSTPAAPVSRGRPRLKDPGSAEQLRPFSGTTQRPEPCRPGWTGPAVGGVATRSASRGPRCSATATGGLSGGAGPAFTESSGTPRHPSGTPAAPPAPAPADEAHRKARLTESPCWAQPPALRVRAPTRCTCHHPGSPASPQISRPVTTRPGNTNGSPLPERPLAPQMAPWPSCSAASSQIFPKMTARASPKPAQWGAGEAAHCDPPAEHKATLAGAVRRPQEPAVQEAEVTRPGA